MGKIEKIGQRRKQPMTQINITATCESIEQAKKLLQTDISTLYFGEEKFGLRLPHYFAWDEIEKITKLAHQANKTVTIAVNAIMHPEKMAEIGEYLKFLEKIKVDCLTVGDAGVIYVLKRDKYKLPYIYDASTMVTNARQINFWAQHGAIGGVIAREVPKLELKEMSKHLNVFGQILVYGASVIHQSKRPLLQNYYNFIHSKEDKSKERQLFLSEPKKTDTHYSIFEDTQGTHIFANNDINLCMVLDELVEMGYTHWFLDGLYTSGEDFAEIVSLYVQAKHLLENQEWNLNQATMIDEKIRNLHPQNRGLDTGFYQIDPDLIK